MAFANQEQTAPASSNRVAQPKIDVCVRGQVEWNALPCGFATRARGTQLAASSRMTVTRMWSTQDSRIEPSRWKAGARQITNGAGRHCQRWARDETGNVSLEYLICFFLLGVVGVSKFIGSVGWMFVESWEHRRDCIYAERNDVCLRQAQP
jgi:hypothetical protein